MSADFLARVADFIQGSGVNQSVYFVQLPAAIKRGQMARSESAQPFDLVNFSQLIDKNNVHELFQSGRLGYIDTIKKVARFHEDHHVADHHVQNFVQRQEGRVLDRINVEHISAADYQKLQQVIEELVAEIQRAHEEDSSAGTTKKPETERVALKRDHGPEKATSKNEDQNQAKAVRAPRNSRQQLADIQKEHIQEERAQLKEELRQDKLTKIQRQEVSDYDIKKGNEKK